MFETSENSAFSSNGGIDLNRPNLYKGIVGIMDITYKEMSEKLSRRGLEVADVSEICRAARGYPGPKYDKIRRRMIAVFMEWCAELAANGSADDLREYMKISRLCGKGRKIAEARASGE